jgi:hypothetical protein
MPGGRPRKYKESQVAEIAKAFERYIDEQDIPIIVEFCYLNRIERETIYDYDEFSTLRKRCIAKKEAALERGMLTNTINTTGAIFSLKQLGWSDRRELSGPEGGAIVVQIDKALADV